MTSPRTAHLFTSERRAAAASCAAAMLPTHPECHDDIANLLLHRPAVLDCAMAGEIAAAKRMLAAEAIDTLYAIAGAVAATTQAA